MVQLDHQQSCSCVLYPGCLDLGNRWEQFFHDLSVVHEVQNVKSCLSTYTKTARNEPRPVISTGRQQKMTRNGRFSHVVLLKTLNH